MLAMERLPLSQTPFSGHMSLSSPTMHSPRAGIPAPLIQGLPSPPALHTSHHGSIVAHPTLPKVRPGSNSSLSSVHTPPPYGDSTMMGSVGPPVYSPTHTSSLLPPSSAEHHDQLACHRAGIDPSRHGLTMPSLSSMIGHQSMPIVSSAQETNCGTSSSPVVATREHQSSSPSGKPIQQHYSRNCVFYITHNDIMCSSINQSKGE